MLIDFPRPIEAETKMNIMISKKTQDIRTEQSAVGLDSQTYRPGKTLGLLNHLSHKLRNQSRFPAGYLNMQRTLLLGG